MDIIVSVVILLVGITCALRIYIIYRNQKLKRRDGKLIIGKKVYCKEIPGRPTMYIVKVEYELNNTVKCKKMIIYDKKIKEHADGEEIPLLYVEAINKIFWAEDSSHEWLHMIGMLIFFCVLMLLISGVCLMSLLHQIIPH